MATYVLLMTWREAGGMPTSDELEAAFGRGSGNGAGSDMFEKRRALMQEWADYCAGGGT